MGGYRRRWTAAGLGRRPARGPVKPLGGGGVVVLPTDDLFLELDARSGVTESGGAGTGVSDWADQSAAGNDFEQTTSGDRPDYNSSDSNFGGSASLTFDGVDHWMSSAAAIDMTGNTAFTMYMVVNLTFGGRILFDWAGGDTWRHDLNTTTDVHRVRADGATSNLGSASEGVQILAMVADGTTQALYRGNTLVGSVTTNTVTPTGTLAIGATTGGSVPAIFDTPAIFGYEAAHDGTQRTAVYAYITQEWGVYP